MKTTHKDRVNQLITALGLSKNKFAKAIGTSSAVISNITTGDVNYGVELAEKIISTFPTVSPTWLLTGIGEMMLSKAGVESPLESPLNSPLAKKWDNRGDSENEAGNSPGDTVEGKNDPYHQSGQQGSVKSIAPSIPAAVLALHFDVNSLESVKDPNRLNPWATGLVIELQQNQHWLGIDRQLVRVLGRLLRVEELLEDLVGFRFDDVSYKALRENIIQRPRFDAAGNSSDPIAEMTEAQKRAYYASRERLLDQCESQLTYLLETLHASITHPANLDHPPRKGSAGEALRPFLEQRHQERYGNDENE